jgi:hypothetical protein
MRKMGARKQGCKSVNMPARFTPLLSILVTFGKTSCTTLDVRPPLPPPHAIYPNADNGA